MTTFEKVREVISKQLSLSKEKINETTIMADELGADSLDMVEVVLELEDEFSISIPDEEIVKLKTIQDLVDYIDSHKKK